MTKNNRSIVVLGDVEDVSMTAVREAADAVGTPVVTHAGDMAGILAADAPTPLLLLVSMRGGAAFETCAQVRGDTRFAGIPIVAIGEPRNALSFTELFHSGGDDIVAPGDAGSFVRRLRAVVSRVMPRESAMPGADGHAVIAGTNAKWQMIIARALSNAGVPTRFVTTFEEAIAESPGAKVVVASDDFGPNGAQMAVAQARRSGSETPWVIVAPPKQMAAIGTAVAELARVAVVDAFAPPENALFVANELANPSGADNRAAPRLLFGTTVSFRAAGREEEDDVGFTYNVSANGIFVRTLAPLESGEDVWLELCAPRSSRRVRLVGKVAWRRHFGPNESATVPPGFGIQIADGLAGDLERWRDGCEVLARDEMRVRPARFAPKGRSSYVPSLIARAAV